MNLKADSRRGVRKMELSSSASGQVDREFQFAYLQSLSLDLVCWKSFGEPIRACTKISDTKK